MFKVIIAYNYTKGKEKRYYDDFQDFRKKNADAKLWMATTKARQVYTDADFAADDYIMFGKERQLAPVLL